MRVGVCLDPHKRRDDLKWIDNDNERNDVKVRDCKFYF
jgi:hypothetical protein